MSAKQRSKTGTVTSVIGVMEYWSNGEVNSCPHPAPHYSNTPLTRFCSFLLVPFQYDAVHYSTNLEELFLVMHHVRARKTGDGVVLAQKNRLLGANFFAHSAKNAADHVDIERLRIFLDFGEPIGRGDFARNNFNRAWRTNEFAELACHATHTPVFIADKRGCAAIIVRQVAVPFLLGVLHRNLGPSQQQVFEMLKRDSQPRDDGRQIQSFAPVYLWAWTGACHGYM